MRWLIAATLGITVLAFAILSFLPKGGEHMKGAAPSGHGSASVAGVAGASQRDAEQAVLTPPTGQPAGGQPTTVAAGVRPASLAPSADPHGPLATAGGFLIVRYPDGRQQQFASPQEMEAARPDFQRKGGVQLVFDR